jgi:hypothetical protein
MRLLLALVLGCASFASAQKLNVKIINRADNAQSYAYATFYSNTAAGAIFQVSGAALTLQLPDGRIAVVNCTSKFAEHFAGPIGNRRSCHVPLVDDIRAEFHGDAAKLIWVVSLDSKKTQSETYKILAVIDSPLKANGPRSADQPAPSSAMPSGPQNTSQPTPLGALPKDLFVWFDEPAPQSGAPLFEVVVTARAYDGALAILRHARHGNTSVQAGTSVLDTDYHPSTRSLASWQESNPNSSPSLFYWQGEDVSGTTLVMHFQMTKRAYEQMLALVAGSDLRVRPSQTSH